MGAGEGRAIYYEAVRPTALDDLNTALHQVSLTLLAYLPELGTLNRKQIAALVGVASFSQDSGPYLGKRSVGQDEPELRSALYMGALVVSRRNSVLGEFYQRLLDAGKPKKLTLVALVKKLLATLNSIVRTGER